jgi:hypothetical protein
MRLRLIVYAYGALLGLGVVVFPRQWWAVSIAWFVIAFGFVAWLSARNRRAHLDAGFGPGTKKSNDAFLRRMIPSLIACGAGLLLLGVTVMTLSRGGPTTAHIVFGSLLLGFGAITLIWAAVLRFRRPTRDS